MGKTIFYIVFSRVQEERHSRAGIAQGAEHRFRMVRWECNDGTGMKSEKGINKNGTGMVK